MTTVRHVEFGEFTEEQLRVHRAGEALHRDGASPAGALELLAAIIEDRTWERLTDIHGQSFKDRFREFVEARTPFGLGFDADQLPKVLGLRHPHEGTPRVAERMATMRTAVSSELRAAEPAAGPEIHAGPGRGKTLRDTKGFEDTATRVVARLKRDDPELAELVIAGEITPNAAARSKGWRRPRIVVSTPERTAASLRRVLPPDTRRALARLLLDD